MLHAHQGPHVTTRVGIVPPRRRPSTARPCSDLSAGFRVPSVPRRRFPPAFRPLLCFGSVDLGTAARLCSSIVHALLLCRCGRCDRPRVRAAGRHSPPLLPPHLFLSPRSIVAYITAARLRDLPSARRCGVRTGCATRRDCRCRGSRRSRWPDGAVQTVSIKALPPPPPRPLPPLRRRGSSASARIRVDATASPAQCVRRGCPPFRTFPALCRFCSPAASARAGRQAFRKRVVGACGSTRGSPVSPVRNPITFDRAGIAHSCAAPFLSCVLQIDDVDWVLDAPVVIKLSKTQLVTNRGRRAASAWLGAQFLTGTIGNLEPTSQTPGLWTTLAATTLHHGLMGTRGLGCGSRGRQGRV